MRILVVHPYQQHSYFLVKAICFNGHDVDYVTSVYDKKYSIVSVLKKFLAGDSKVRASTRSDSDISESTVHLRCEFYSLLVLFLQRLPYLSFIYKKMKLFFEKSFDKSVLNMIKTERYDAIVTFDKFSFRLYELIDKEGIKVNKILDLSAPGVSYCKALMPMITPDFDLYYLDSKKSDNEINTADMVLVASKFSEESVRFVDANKKVSICRYGGTNINPSQVVCLEKSYNDDVKIIFCGRVSYDKGAKSLEKLISNYKFDGLSFHIYGHVRDAFEKLRVYHNVYCYGHVAKAKIQLAFAEGNIMYFPTYYDGFGLSVTEAMSYGVVVICSRNAGVSDLIKHGFNGFLVEPTDVEMVANYVEMLLSDRALLNHVAHNAFLTAKTNDWMSYYKQVGYALSHFE